LLLVYSPRSSASGRNGWLAGVLAISLLLAGCGADAAPGAEPALDEAGLAEQPVAAVDDSGREVRLPRPARRVVSLVPSGTETIYAMGGVEQLVGRTNYDRAAEVAHLPSGGGGLDPSLEALIALRPELVVAWDADKSPGLRQRLEEMGVAVFAMRTRDTADVFNNIERLGRLVGRDASADALARSIRAELEAVRRSVAGRERPSVLYVVWNDPPMTAGPNTFIAQVIEIAGGRTIFPDLKQDWPQVAMEEIVRRQPDIVVLPVGDDRVHTVRRVLDAPGWRELAAVREGRVSYVPTDLMNRPGPFLGEAARAMRDALHAVPAGD
jgi:iron complex transport system substrate-binding protein